MEKALYIVLGGIVVVGVIILLIVPVGVWLEAWRTLMAVLGG